MVKRPGKIIRLEDGRVCIVYRHQPLKGSKKIILHLADKKYNPILDDKGKEKILLKDVETFEKQMEFATLIGYTD